MVILENLLDQIPLEKIAIRDIHVGVHWTAVCSKNCGLASTILNGCPHGEEAIRNVGELHKLSAQELAHWVLSENKLESSIGMAALNSLIEIDESFMVEMNASELITQKGKDKNIAIIGHFPFAKTLLTIAKNCWVIEKRPIEGEYTEQSAPDLISQADIVAISGTTLINHTLEELLTLCSPETLVIVLGPSTPLSAGLFQFGISILSGVKIIDENAALRTIQQGAIFPQVKGVRLLTIKSEKMNSKWK